MSDQSEGYPVERVIGKKIMRGKVYYKIKWLNYSDRYNSWEPIEHCEGAMELVKEYEKSVRQSLDAINLTNELNEQFGTQNRLTVPERQADIVVDSIPPRAEICTQTSTPNVESLIASEIHNDISKIEETPQSEEICTQNTTPSPGNIDKPKNLSVISVINQTPRVERRIDGKNADKEKFLRSQKHYIDEFHRSKCNPGSKDTITSRKLTNKRNDEHMPGKLTVTEMNNTKVVKHDPTTSKSTRNPYPAEQRIERIVDRKFEIGEVFYLVKWFGESNENTWVPFKKCISELDLIYEFELRSRERRDANVPTARRSNPLSKEHNYTLPKPIPRARKPKKSVSECKNTIETEEKPESKELESNGTFTIKEVQKTVEGEIVGAAQSRKNEKEELNDVSAKIECFIDKKLMDGEVFYKVKWRNNYPKETTWEPFCNCLVALEKLREFEEDLEIGRVPSKTTKKEIIGTEMYSIKTHVRRIGCPRIKRKIWKKNHTEDNSENPDTKGNQVEIFSIFR